MAEMFADPHLAARGMFERYTPPGANPEVTIGGNPIKFSELATGLYRQPPKLGEHTDEVLAEFGVVRS